MTSAGGPTPEFTWWRAALAQCSDARRQAWGERANELEAQGLPWDVAEEQAFHDTQSSSIVPETTLAVPVRASRRRRSGEATLFK